MPHAQTGLELEAVVVAEPVRELGYGRGHTVAVVAARTGSDNYGDIHQRRLGTDDMAALDLAHAAIVVHFVAVKDLSLQVPLVAVEGRQALEGGSPRSPTA